MYKTTAISYKMVSLYLVALAFIPAIHWNQVSASDSSLSWSIYHSWKPNQEFEYRGSLVWGSKTSSDGTDDEKKEFQIINDDANASLTPEDIREMLDYGWYHVSIKSNNSNGKETLVFQTVPACNLRRANFKDQFEITLPRSSLGEKQDRMTSFAYTPLVSPLAPKTCDDYDEGDDSGDAANNTRSFSSRVSVLLDTPAMTLKNVLPTSKPPPGIAFVKRPKQPGQQGGGSAEDDGDGDSPPTIPGPFSFLSKYWYIVLPMLILQLITVPEEPPQQGQQQGQQGGNQSGGGTVAPQAPASAQKARRGKTSKK